MFIYRTFHNVKNGVNVQIHSFLYTLEQIIEKEGKSSAIYILKPSNLIGKLFDTIYR